MADSGMQHHIKHIPSQRAYEKLSHICGLSKFCAQQFCRLGGVDKLVLEGLLPFPCSSAEACRTASFVPAFCATHESRDLVRRLGGCHYLAKMLLVEGGSELDDARQDKRHRHPGDPLFCPPASRSCRWP